MPIYTFENKQGDREEMFFTMRECPQEIVKDGVTFMKVITAPGLIHFGELGTQGHKYPYVSHSLPHTLKGAETVRYKNKKGKMGREKVIVKSRKHEKEIQAKYGYDKH